MFRLLSTSNTKTQKGVKLGYATYILHLSPSDVSGYINTCPKATPGCKIGCLNTAGHGGMFVDIEDSKVQKARIRRTRQFALDRTGFMLDLVDDIKKAIEQATKKGLIPVFRLNGTSDLSWEKYKLNGKHIFQHFPTEQFYDYTKVLGRKVNHIHNYHLTFSRGETNQADVDAAIAAGMNVAYVFDKTPTTYDNMTVFDGDDTDLRFLDPQGVIVGLKAKGRARKDTSGFVIRTK